MYGLRNINALINVLKWPPVIDKFEPLRQKYKLL